MLIVNSVGTSAHPNPEIDASPEQPFMEKTGIPFLEKLAELPSTSDPLSPEKQDLIFAIMYHSESPEQEEQLNPHGEFLFGLCVRAGTPENPARMKCGWFRDIDLGCYTKTADQLLCEVMELFIPLALRQLEEEGGEQLHRLAQLNRWYTAYFLPTGKPS